MGRMCSGSSADFMPLLSSFLSNYLTFFNLPRPAATATAATA